ncbi:hypothetical protein MNR02_07495 [Shinella sp. H4-D48]|uniref:hypothetical protein n=1 Tax=Shinella sp. H4-D48 TaxID=2925841 RepID=UPI001F53217E|nr:hypothetical protein [Shinella sp. H4-D48]UNK39544.1 hypothetical protein MNR02_07495 [Shinella sp. H4-D48]
MSPEWMIAFDRQEAKLHGTKRTSLADPLERTDWQGFQWVNALLSRMVAVGGQRPAKSRQSTVSRWIFASEVSRRR